MGLDGQYLEKPQTAYSTGTTDTTIDALLKPKDGFITPSQQQVTITGDGLASVDYYYEREKYTLTIQGTTLGVESIAEPKTEDIYFEAKVTLNQDIVKYSTGYEFDKWSYDGKSSTDETLTFNMPSHNVTVTVVPKQIEYKVSFESENPYREKVPPQPYHYGDKISKINEGTWPHHDFEGWYLKESNGDLADTAWNFETDTMPAKNITLVGKSL